MKNGSYRDREISRLIEYKENILEITDHGLDDRDHPQAHVLPRDQWRENLWVGIRKKVQKYELDYPIKWQGSNNLTSSQILCFNLLFPFNEDPTSLNSYFTEKIPDFKGIKEGSMRFEFTDKTLLKERKSTNVDLFFEWFDHDETLNAVILEFKYCESKFNGCSNSKRTGCQDFRALYNDPQNCYLKDEYETKYWDIVLDPEGPVNIDLLPKKGSCPFQADLYQLMRNQLFAFQVGNLPKYSRAVFAVMYPSTNEGLQAFPGTYLGTNNPIDIWEKLIRKKESFLKISIEDFLQTIYTNLPDHLTEWRTFMTKKHPF